MKRWVAIVGFAMSFWHPHAAQHHSVALSWNGPTVWHGAPVVYTVYRNYGKCTGPWVTVGTATGALTLTDNSPTLVSGRKHCYYVADSGGKSNIATVVIP